MMDGWMMDGQMDGWMDGWMTGAYMDGLSGWMDGLGPKEKQKHKYRIQEPS